MGFKASEWAFKLERLDPAMKAVLAALAHRADDKTWECFPGQDTLAAMTGTSRATVGRALAGLESRKIITRSRRMRADGSRTSDLCILNRDYASGCNVAESNDAPSNVAHNEGLSITVQPPMLHSDTAIEDQEEIKKEDQSVNLSIADDFEKFYSMFPRKQAKADALKAYKQARKTTSAKTILDGAQAYTLISIGQKKSFLKMPAGWLRGQRWQDEPVAPAARPLSRTERNLEFVGQLAAREATESQADESRAITAGFAADFCPVHPGYPSSATEECAACLRDEAEGRSF